MGKTLKPAGWYVLVEIEKCEEETKGGIIIAKTIADREDNNSDVGTVIALGPIAFKDRGGPEHWPKVGDKVLFAKHGGKKFDDYRLINDEDVFAWVEEE